MPSHRDKAELVYLDACILINKAENRLTDKNGNPIITQAQLDGSIECCRRLDEGIWKAVGSTVIVTELVKKKSREMASIYDGRIAELYDATLKICEFACDLREEIKSSKVGLADAIHLATAIAAKVDRFITTDSHIIARAEWFHKQHGLNIIDAGTITRDQLLLMDVTSPDLDIPGSD